MNGGVLNCSILKDITSGTQTTTRKIFQEAKITTMNVTLTIQTNKLLGYSEDTDATRRRITVVPFRAKFINDSQEKRLGNVHNKHKADGSFNDRIMKEPRYAEALLHYFLPYASEILKKGWKATSSIPRPQSIKDYTDASFDKSNPYSLWLKLNIVPVRNRAIGVTEVVNAYKSAIVFTSNQRVRAWSDPMQRDLLNQIEGTFMGRLYKLKDDFYNESKTAITEQPEGICDEDMIEYYLEQQAINGFEEGHSLPDRSDIYVVGYAFRDDVGMDDIDENDERGEEFCGVDVREH
jgi:hypothetical protein